MKPATTPHHADQTNQHGEVHVSCTACAPGGERGICGSALKGIIFPNGTPTTCAVCVDLSRMMSCPNCGGEWMS